MAMTMTRRQFARQPAALAMALGLAACGGGDDNPIVGLLLTAFLLTAVIGGVDDGSIRVQPTGNGFLSLEPGVALTINSDVPVVFTISASNVTIATPVVTSRSWTTAGVTSTASGQFVLSVSLFGDPSVNATITINVTPK